MDTQFWTGLLAIIGIDLVLAGDNAVVIALAARNLPPELQRKAVVFGALAAVVLRGFLTAIVVFLLQVPLLKLIGGLVLIHVAYSLAVDDGDHEDVDPAQNLKGAIKTIVIADVVMSLDNVLAVAAAAHGSILLIVIGLAISIPIIMFGSTIMINVLNRYPILVFAGALLVAYVGVELILFDEFVHSRLPSLLADNLWLERSIGVVVGIVVVTIAYLRKNSFARKKLQSQLSDDHSTHA